jgi:HlyD family secretion protein
MTLRAPFDGIVADISGELGEYATPSPPGIPTLPAIDLIDDSCLYVSAPIDEVDAAKLVVGQHSRITLDAMKGHTFSGKVRRIAPYVLDLEKQARTVEVEVEFSELAKSENLLVGYSADVEIVHATREKVLRIPTQTLMEGNRVLLYGSDGVLEERKVSTGLSNWEYAEVISGLNEGDQIVSSLDRPGVKAGVRVVQEELKPAK